MQEPSPLDTSESPDERMRKRRARRWRRRARIAGPFAGVLLLLAALSLSVDLIEYQPQPERDRLTDRPLPTVKTTAETPTRTRPIGAALSAASVVDAEPRVSAPVDRAGMESDALDVTLMPGPDALPSNAPPPRPPYSTRRPR